MDGLDITRVRTSLNRAPSHQTPAERDEKHRELHQELLERHGAVVVRLDQEPGCWSDRQLFARGRIIVVRLDKLAFIPRWISMFLETLAKGGWKDAA
jgi:hypothetical protein